MLIALSKIAAYEKQVKTSLINNMILFEKFPEVLISQMGNRLKVIIQQAAALACDSHPRIGKA